MTAAAGNEPTVRAAGTAMDKAMSAVLMADFTGEQIGHKPATWCRNCSAAVRAKTSKSCGEHRVSRCPKCKTSVTEAHTCLDFVGHADVRARLCDADPGWTWAPYEFPGIGSLILSDGQPVGLWITLTVGGVSKPGYGSVDKGKPEAMKELIGDALRNAGLSFGIAWKLWAKGERSSGDGEGGQTGTSSDTWDNTTTPARAAQAAAQPVAPVPPRLESDDSWAQKIEDIKTPDEADAAEAELKKSYEAGEIEKDRTTQILHWIRVKAAPMRTAASSSPAAATAPAGEPASDGAWVGEFMARLSAAPLDALNALRREIGQAVVKRKITPDEGSALSAEVAKRRNDLENPGEQAEAPAA